MWLTVRSWDSKFRRQRKDSETEWDKHASRHKNNCTSKVQSQSHQTASAMIFTNSSRTHTHKASEMQIHCIMCGLKFRIMQRIFQKLQIKSFFSWQGAGWLIRHISVCIPLRPTKQKYWFIALDAQKTICALGLASLACRWELKKIQEGSRLFAELALRERVRNENWISHSKRDKGGQHLFLWLGYYRHKHTHTHTVGIHNLGKCQASITFPLTPSKRETFQWNK